MTNLKGKAEELARQILQSGALLSGVAEGQVYIKTLYEHLKGTEFEFETKSPMASRELHVNGFIKYDEFSVKIYPSADGRFVLIADEFNVTRLTS